VGGPCGGQQRRDLGARQANPFAGAAHTRIDELGDGVVGVPRRSPCSRRRPKRPRGNSTVHPLDMRDGVGKRPCSETTNSAYFLGPHRVPPFGLEERTRLTLLVEAVASLWPWLRSSGASGRLD